MATKSAGIIAYRFRNKVTEYFLGHPGGPFYKNKDAGVWSIPKGEFDESEDALTAAIREFEEEIGQKISGEFIPLAPVKYKNGKIIYAWGVMFDFDESKLVSNQFSLEWPPKSGKEVLFPEIDKGGWFKLEEVREKILPAQFPLIDQLQLIIKE